MVGSHIPELGWRLDGWMACRLLCCVSEFLLSNSTGKLWCTCSILCTSCLWLILGCQVCVLVLACSLESVFWFWGIDGLGFLREVIFFFITCLLDLGCLSRFKLFSGARCRTKPVLMWVSTSSISFGEAFFQLSLWWLCVLGSPLLVLWSFFSRFLLVFGRGFSLGLWIRVLWLSGFGWSWGCDVRWIQWVFVYLSLCGISSFSGIVFGKSCCSIFGFHVDCHVWSFDIAKLWHSLVFNRHILWI